MRLKILRIIFVLSFCIIGFSLIYNQALRGYYFYQLSKNNRIRVVPKEARRGKIFDRNGVVLADNRISFDVMLVAQEIKDRKEEIFSFLSQVLQIEKGKLVDVFKKRMVTPFAPVVVARDVPREMAIVLEENKFQFPGLIIQVGSKRYYPFEDIGAHVVGYVGKLTRTKLNELKNYGYTVHNIAGKFGIEEYYDSYLKGEAGGYQVEVNNRGEQVRLLGFKEPVSGQDIVLTLDNRIQKMSTELMGDRKGTIIVMGVETGEILGMVSSPSYDPNLFIEGSLEVSKLFSDSKAPLLNRAISGKFPPGSVFKVPLAICALENKKLDLKTTFKCPGYYKLGRRRFKCAHSHGVQNLTEGLAHSCNVFFYNTGLLLGPELIHQYAKLFNLGNLTNIDLPYEVKGYISEKSQWRRIHNRGWSKGDTLNFSIGQGDVQVTPLQIVQMMTTIERNGKGVQPHLIKFIGGSPVLKDYQKERVVISKETFEIVKGGLRAAVGDYSGTAHILDIKGLPVYGKTGTAQSSRDKLDHAWFVGVVSSSRTNIAFCIFLEHGGSSYYACQIARQLLIRMQKEKIL